MITYSKGAKRRERFEELLDGGLQTCWKGPGSGANPPVNERARANVEHEEQAHHTDGRANGRDRPDRQLRKRTVEDQRESSEEKWRKSECDLVEYDRRKHLHTLAGGG